MSTPDDAPIPPARPTGILRVSCGLFVALAGACAFWVLSLLSRFAGIFENMVEGGVQALPVTARLVIEGRGVLMGLVATVLILACVTIWKSRRDQPVLIATVAAALFFGGLAIVTVIVIMPVLTTVIQKFETKSP